MFTTDRVNNVHNWQSSLYNGQSKCLQPTDGVQPGDRVNVCNWQSSAYSWQSNIPIDRVNVYKTYNRLSNVHKWKTSISTDSLSLNPTNSAPYSFADTSLRKARSAGRLQNAVQSFPDPCSPVFVVFVVCAQSSWWFATYFADSLRRFRMEWCWVSWFNNQHSKHG